MSTLISSLDLVGLGSSMLGITERTLQMVVSFTNKGLRRNYQ